MELVRESRATGSAASTTSGQVIDEIASNARPKPNEIREIDSDPTGWHTHHRLDDYQANLYHQPEKMLMFAILVDAILALTNCPLRRKWSEVGNGSRRRIGSGVTGKTGRSRIVTFARP